MTDAALSDVVVLELATGVAGPYCGRLLADLGAQVVKVEPRGGDPVRHEPPLVGRERLLQLPQRDQARRRNRAADPHLDDLAAHADIVIHALRGRTARRARCAAAGRPRGRDHRVAHPVRSQWRTTWLANERPHRVGHGGYHYFGGAPDPRAHRPARLPGRVPRRHAWRRRGAYRALARAYHRRGPADRDLPSGSHSLRPLTGW